MGKRAKDIKVNLDTENHAREGVIVDTREPTFTLRC
jgi:hypothetical protein